MGVDKPDVRQIIHWGVPKTVEAYYQQAGRAGRDGDIATCTLFYAASDFVKMEHMLKDDCVRVKQGLLDMKRYCSSNRCRRQSLVEHFGESSSICGKCDVCTAIPLEEKIDISADVRCALNAVVECSSRYGITTIIGVLKANVKHEWLKVLPSHGTGRSHTINHWKQILAECRSAGLIQENARGIPNKNTVFAAIALTASGASWLENDDSKLYMAMPSVSNTQNTTSELGDDRLYDRLVRERTKLAGRLPLYVVCSNKTLREIAQIRPTNKKHLAEVAGMGKVKAEKYGDAILRCVRMS
jgi:ATP-dependent DNA helicase RecQ